jgi:hypothetical protein
MIERIAHILDNEPYQRGLREYTVIVYQIPGKHGDVAGSIDRATDEEAIQWVKSRIMPLVPDDWSVEVCYMDTNDFYEDVTVVIWSSNEKECV